MAKDIVVIQSMGDALRNTGYKNIECAMAEIIDNSIEAKAKDVFIIVSEEYNENTGRNNISEIAFLDNGKGMDDDELESCLGIGFSTRTDRKGMGRFGVGLPQASLYACPSIEVYSWQGGYENCRMVYLDIDKVKEGIQTNIEDPIFKGIPKKYKKYLEYTIVKNNENVKFKESGTFVLWKNCDRVVPKTVNCLFKKLDFALGQKFRYFLHNNECKIYLIANENQDTVHNIKPNDPLMLMEDNYVLGNPNKPGDIDPYSNEDCTEPVFEAYGDEEHPDGVFIIPVKYLSRSNNEIKESKVEIRFSKVKDIFYDLTAIPQNPGNTELGKHVKKLEGVSIVRANREIDFGRFDFYDNINEPQHRWWGCEIRFEPELDEAFGVANNKQHVELGKVEKEDFEGEPIKSIWEQLDIVKKTIDELYKKNKLTRKSARTTKDNVLPATKIINSVENKNKDVGTAAEIKNTTDINELIEKNRNELIEQGVENPTVEETTNYMNNSVNIKYANAGKMGGLFDYSFDCGNCLLTINLEHIFYREVLEKIFNDSDAKTAFELFLGALVKAMDETYTDQGEQNENLMSEWNMKLKKYINEQQNFAKRK